MYPVNKFQELSSSSSDIRKVDFDDGTFNQTSSIQDSFQDVLVYDYSKEEQNNVREVTIIIKKDPIKSEPEDMYEAMTQNSYELAYKAEVSDLKIEIKQEDAAISKVELVDTVKNEYMSDEEHTFGNDSKNEMSNIIKVECEWRNSPTPLRNQNQTLINKQLVLEEDVMLNKYSTLHFYKQLTAKALSSTKDKESNHHSSIKESILTNTTETIKALKYKSTTTDDSSVSDHCNISQAISSRTSNVNSYNENEALTKLFICDICDKPFHQKSTLVQHIQEHPKVYNCTYCSYKTFYKSNLNQHVNMKHTKTTIFYCCYCSHKAYLKGDLNKHINSKHTKSTVFSCSHCSFKAFHKGDLNKHINSRHTKSIVFNCPHCSYKAYQKGNLNQHINTHHTKRTVFNCSHCDYKAYHKGHLTQHVNNIHFKSNLLNCSYCDYKAYQKGSLNRHINSQHLKSIVYNCSHCSYETYHKSHLNRHVKAKHS